MKEFWLWRFPSIPGVGTFGVMLDDYLPFCLSVEREWLNNQKGISCYPGGDFICRRVRSPKFGNTFEITGIEGRSDCVFHWGAIEDDSHGCTILGEQYEYVYIERLKLGKPGILASKDGAFKEFLKRTEGINEFLLHVRWIKEVIS